MDAFFKSKEFLDKLHQYEAGEAMRHGEMLWPNDLVDIADYYEQTGHRTQALIVIKEAMKTFPGSTLPHLFYARYLLFVRGDIEGARKYSEKITDKDSSDYCLFHAELLINDNKSGDAFVFLKQQYCKIDDEDLEEYALDAADLLIEYEMADEAEFFLELVSDTDSEEYKEIKGNIHVVRGEYKKSEGIFNQLLDINPFSTSYWNSLASSQFLNDDINESIKSSEYTLAINPDDYEAMLNKANGLYTLGNYNEAMTWYERYCEHCPEDEVGYLFRGVIYMINDKPGKAMIMLNSAEEKAASDSPYLVDIYHNLALVHSMLGSLKRALGYVNKAELIDSDNYGLEVVRAHILLNSDHEKEAKMCYEKAISDSGYDPTVIIQAAISLFDSNHLMDADVRFRQLFKLKGEEWPDGHAYYARCRFAQGDYTTFMHQMRIAIRLNPNEAEAALADLFPVGTPVSDYERYMVEVKLKGKKY